jgi:hypothetical protein
VSTSFSHVQEKNLRTFNLRHSKTYMIIALAWT